MLRSLRVDYVVAPYEADAQMYHLERMGLVDGIITEDSDLLVFGARKVGFLPRLFSFISMSLLRSSSSSSRTAAVTRFLEIDLAWFVSMVSRFVQDNGRMSTSVVWPC